jgi:hypothetical protein
MIVVTGSVTAREDIFNEILRLSREHVNRSRTEPGYIAHAVHVDCENPLLPSWISRRRSRSFLAAVQSNCTLPIAHDTNRLPVPIEIRPNVSATLAAGRAGETWLKDRTTVVCRANDQG